ncbi:MAG TPA: alpha/beta fold hydrolase [Methylomirabilota bacterium]|nr:alpha/beta fold hydrolase [Methylomirabilota bacterium]
MSTYVLDLRERDVGGAVTSGHLYVDDDLGLLDADGPALPAFTALTRGRDVVLLLHGYNTTRPAGLDSLTRFGRFLEVAGTTALIVAVLWPGDGWAKALTYPFEGRDADDSAASLVTWIKNHVDHTARISLVAHSLGCRVAMRAAQLLAEAAAAAVPALGRVCLMAPAIDNDCLGRDGITCYRLGTLATERLAVLASADDRVLGFAFPLGDLAQTVLFGGRWGRALGLTGVNERNPDVLARIEHVPLSKPGRKIDHSDYLGVHGADVHTIAQADEFVASFLGSAPAPHVWLAAL